jgi:peptide-methionine (S)-S-oxide reductase
MKTLSLLALLLATAAPIGAAEALNQPTPPAPPGYAKATFAGGCFWCMEAPFDALPGVQSVVPGYTGGSFKNPSYEQVSSGGTGHAEAVEIVYDPKQISYEKLLYVFWRNIDPVTRNRQFCDGGEQYRSAVFWHDEEQKKLAESTRKELDAAGRFKTPIVTEIVPASTFYLAEEYHRQYYKKNPIRYNFYRRGCGRDARLEELWGEEARGGKEAGH